VRGTENVAVFTLNTTTQHSHGQYGKLKLATFVTDEADSRLREQFETRRRFSQWPLAMTPSNSSVVS